MAYAGLHVSHEPRIFFEPRCCYQNKNVMRNHGLHLVRMRLPSLVWLKGGDASSSRLFSRGRCSVHPLNSKYRQKILVCRSSLLPTDVNQIPIIKTAGLVIKSSYDVLSGSPLALKLIPAFGVVAFAAWGLGPLIRLIRIIFLQRSDNSWKKSNTHYITSSYVQPLLIWTGVTLICRALDPVVLPTEASQTVKLRLLNFARSLSTVLAFAYCLSSLIQQAQKFFVEKNESTDASRNMGFSFAGKAIYSAVWVAAVSLFMELLGFSTQKWLTAGGLGTVLLTLAGREIFTNFLSSVMIHATRPFVVNEWIQTKIEGYEVSGTVEHVGWWSPTIIRGDDREAVHIPNHKFTVSVVRNLTQKTHWRIKTHLAISHLDVNKINSIVADMRKVLAKNPQVEQQRLHRRVFLENINPENQALMILISCFVKTSHFEEYLCVKEAILLDLLRVISHHRARLATPIRTVQKIYSDADIENIPFADGMYSRPRGSGNRPLLLIEPSYKVSGEEKSKSPSRKPNEEKDAAKVETTSVATDLKEAKKDEKASKVVTNAAASEKKDQILGKPDSPKDKKTDALKEASSSDFVSGKVDKDGERAVASEKKDQNLGKPEKKDQILGKPDSPKDKKTDALNVGSSSDLAVAASSPSNTPRAPLEENIVLGVALEGSKRTLPIEEEETVPSEPKELTAQRNGSGSSSGNDGPVSSSS